MEKSFHTPLRQSFPLGPVSEADFARLKGMGIDLGEAFAKPAAPKISHGISDRSRLDNGRIGADRLIGPYPGPIRR